MTNFLNVSKDKSLFVKPPTQYAVPTKPPVYTFQLMRKKTFSKSKCSYHFYESFCLCYKTSSLKKLKGVLNYSFDLKASFKPSKFAFTLCSGNKSEEYHCLDQQCFDKLKLYFSQRINLVGFHENYTAIKKIGKGNFASVFLIENKLNNELFAAKAFLKETLVAEKTGKESLINEIKVMRALSHQNIIKLYEVYETKSSYYMIMELLKGGNLSDFMKSSSHLDNEKIIIIIKSLIKAIKYCHDLEIMHRDIKPENILFRNNDIKEENICIADFGLATYSNVSEYLYKKCGTPGFVAPEILKQNKEGNIKYGVICDMFSVGVLFHLLLIGKQPFVGFSYNEMILLNKECEIDFNYPTYKNLSPLALHLLRGLLEADPMKRLTAAQALKHPYLVGNDSVSSICPSEMRSEEYNNSEEDIKILANNIESINRMKRSIHMLEDLKTNTLSLLSTKEKDPMKLSLSFQESEEKKVDIQFFKNQKQYNGQCSIIITRIPAFTGHMNSIRSSPRNHGSREDLSPVLRKELNTHKEKKKMENFTLMACETRV